MAGKLFASGNDGAQTVVTLATVPSQIGFPICRLIVAALNPLAMDGSGADNHCGRRVGGEFLVTPKFFWSGKAARATGRVIAARVILMGVWRDSS